MKKEDIMKGKMKFSNKRMFSLLLAMVLILSQFSIPVYADNEVMAEDTVQEVVAEEDEMLPGTGEAEEIAAEPLEEQSEETEAVEEQVAENPAVLSNGVSSPVAPTSESEIIKIKSVDDLKNIDYSNTKAYYVLENDIELGKRYYPKDENFKAVFDGKGHTIDFGQMRPAQYLFKGIDPEGIIQNVRFAGKVGKTDYSHHGPCGKSVKGSIINCVTEVEGDFCNGFTESLDGGVVSNCLSLLAGGGTVITDKYTAGTVKNTYWKEGLKPSSSVPQTAMIDCGEKTEEELKSAEFLALLNKNKGENGSEWVKGGNGYPVLKPNTPEAQSVDKTPLENAIKEAEKLVKNHYDTESWKKLQDVLAAAKEVLKKDGITETEITEEAKKVDQAVKALVKVPYVYFKYDNGNIQEMDENDTFTLSALDAGTFMLGGTDKKADWECVSTIEYVNKHYWISGSSGRYQPYRVEKVDATVKNKNNPNEVLKTFHINNVSSKVEEIKVFVNEQEISVDKPYEAKGSEMVRVSVKGKVNGKWISIPTSTALKFDKVSGKGTIRTNGVFQVENNGEAVFEAILIENNKRAEFKAVAKRVALEDFTVTVPKVWYIHEWNGLGNYYLGIMQGDKPERDFQCSFTPANAGNKKLNWKALTPEVAEYMEAFHNGIIPKKAGIAKFEVSSEDNPALKQEVSVEFKYKNPLESATVKEEVVLEEGKYIDLEVATKPKDASEQRFNWKYSKEGIVKIGDAVNIDPENVSTPKWTTHTLTALKAGEVTVTGVPFDETAGCKPIQFTVKVTKDGVAPENKDYLKLAKEDIQHGVKGLQAQKQQSYGDEWAIFTTLRAGASVSQENLDKYYENIKSVLKDEKKVKRMRATDYARVIITLEAMGKDPADVDGTNLLEKLYNNKSLEGDTSNCAIWALIGLDGWKSEIPSDALWTREKLINKILTFQTKDGGFGLIDDKTSSIDITGMALQSLAPYYNDSKYPSVKKAVDKSLEYLKGQKTQNAGYTDSGTENSCSTAQILTAVTALKIDPVKAENGFTSGNKNMITNLDSYKAESGFGWQDNKKENGMATQQATYALVAYERMAEDRAGLYDLTDTQTEKPPVGPESEDKKAAEKVVQAIEKIGTVTLESKAAIQEAREAYDALTEEGKKLVTNYDKLVKAEEELKNLETDNGIKGYVVISVERFTIGQGYIKEPVYVPFKAGDNAATLVKKVIGAENFVGKDEYLEAIKGADAGEDKVNVPKYITDISKGEVTTESVKEVGNDDDSLGQFDYTKYSGWMYMVNNEMVNYGISSYKPQDGDVLRFQFTLYGYGTDLTGYEYGNSEAVVQISNKDAATKLMAEVNKNKEQFMASSKVKAAYDKLAGLVAAVITPQKEIDQAVEELKKAMENPGSDLETVVNQAKAELDTYKDITLYREAQQEEIKQILKDAKAALDQAQNKDEVEKITAESKAKLDQVKTEAQLIEEENKAAAEKVEKLINKIGEVTLESKAAIEEARKAYDALTEEGKKLVTNYDKLTKAEEALKKLEGGQKPNPTPNPEVVTLVNEKYGVTLKGEGLTSDMELVVTPLGKDSNDVDLMRKATPSNKSIFRLFDIKLMKDGKEIELPSKSTLSIPVGEKYNGKELVVLFCNGSKVEQLKGKVEEGSISVEVTELKSFGVVIDTPANADKNNNSGNGNNANGNNTVKGTGPKTGDEAQAGILFMMLAMAGVVLVATRKKMNK